MFSEIIDNQKCPIWGTPAKVWRTSDLDGYFVESESAGCTYKVTGSVHVLLFRREHPFNTEQKVVLQSWLNKERELLVSDDVFPELAGDIPSDVRAILGMSN
ncbi:MAG: hypothetical protein OXE59_11505 [Bacteroidetes bacterium]|nr:hypothetical protein [Bacteroidota bacterium]